MILIGTFILDNVILSSFCHYFVLVTKISCQLPHCSVVWSAFHLSPKLTLSSSFSGFWYLFNQMFSPSTIRTYAGLSSLCFKTSNCCFTNGAVCDTWLTGCNFIWGGRSNFTLFLPISSVSWNIPNRFTKRILGSFDFAFASWKQELLIHNLNLTLYCKVFYFCDLCHAWHAFKVLNEYWQSSKEVINLSSKS